MIRRKDLVDIADKDYNKRQGELIVCQDCNWEGGATRGDLFMLSFDAVLICPDCKSDNLALAKIRTELVFIKR